jgi:hypothetical protein
VGYTIVMRWQRRFESHFLMTKCFCLLPGRGRFMSSERASFAGRRISLQSQTEELAPNRKISLLMQDNDLANDTLSLLCLAGLLLSVKSAQATNQ